MNLSILCITKAEPHALPFLRAMEAVAACARAEFVVAADGFDAVARMARSEIDARVVPVASLGFLESVLEQAVHACQDGYILRLDDDERCSPAMGLWLVAQEYLVSEHWTFPRVHFWRDEQSVLMTSQLFPDHQTRLSMKHLAGGRYTLHAGSPFGPGTYAPVAIEHHKFLVKTREERLAISQRWHSGPMLCFSVPEDAYLGQTVPLVAYGAGVVPWMPTWSQEVAL